MIIQYRGEAVERLLATSNLDWIRLTQPENQFGAALKCDRAAGSDHRRRAGRDRGPAERAGSLSAQRGRERSCSYHGPGACVRRRRYNFNP